MTTVTVEATRDDVEAIEALAQNPMEGYDKICEFVRSSAQTFFVRLDGRLVCMWGVIRPSMLSTEGYLWLLATTLDVDHKFMLIRQSQREIQRLLETYGALIGHCALADYRAHKWLRLLGAKFGYPEGPAIPFRIEKR